MNREVYSKDFFESLEKEKGKALAFKYYINELLMIGDIKRVIDVGCGNGTFLKTFAEYGIDDCCGIDGNPFYEKLEISIDKYICFELDGLDKNYEKLKNKIGERKYDVACCLEVGEHLPDYCANALVTLLTNYSDLILFSAAIPGQGGDAHINEQWPLYWERLFEKCGYTKVDYFRRKTWDIYEIPGYYRQNVYIYVNNKKISNYQILLDYIESGANKILPQNIVHPTVYKYSISNALLEFSPERFPRIKLEEKNILNTKVILNREKLLDYLPVGGVIAEVGVANGDFSKIMIEKLHPKKMYCIDIWTMEERWNNFSKNLKKYIESGIVEVLKGDSVKMLNEIKDNELDFVYIDAMHDYEHPRRELSICKDKVKQDGFIAGDDYVVINVHENPIMQYGVVNAVNEFMVNEDYELVYITIENLYRTPSYCLRKRH